MNFKKLNIREKLVAGMVMLCFGFLAFVYVISNYYLIDRFLELETFRLKTDMQRVHNAISLEQTYVKNMTTDWSHWDEPYNYVQGKNDKFIDENVTVTPYESLNVDVIAFWDKFYNRKFGTMYDPEKKNKIPYPEEIDAFVKSHVKFDDKSTGPFQVAGIISTSQGILILAAAKITNSEGDKPPKGILIMGRLVNKGLIDKFKVATQVELNVSPLSDVKKDSFLNQQYDLVLASPGNFIKHPVNDKTVNTFSVQRDSYDKPIGLISTIAERKIMILGRQTTNTLLLVLGLVSLLGVGAFYLFSNRIIMRRLVCLKDELQEITTAKKFDARVTSRFNDEISYVANQINNMFEVIHKAHTLLEKRVEERTESLNKTNSQLLKEIAERKVIEDELRAHKERLTHLAHFDVLTGLPNRLMLNDKINSTLIESEKVKSKFALLFIDLDRFKSINDAKGHETGDYVLKTIAERIKSIIPTNVLVARIGGDEFVVLFKDFKNQDEINSMCQQILDVCSQPIKDEHQSYHLSASIGVSIYPENGSSLQELQKNADIAMYRSKMQHHGHYIYFEENMKLEATATIELEDQLHRALENEEFRLYFQPKYDIKTGALMGSEALIRWESPKLGFVSPGLFIPYAEKSGLILPIGQWVLDECCRFVLQMKSKGVNHLTTAINLSPVQFNRQDVASLLDEAVRKHGILHQDLEIEITENAILNDTDSSRERLWKLREMGFKIAIDDFGAGATSLQHLKTLPIDCLKIDKSFVDGIPSSPQDMAIVESLINLAHRLEMKVVAEGIETGSQVEFLSVVECDIAQGYYFGRPMTQDQLLFEIEKVQREHNQASQAS